MMNNPQNLCNTYKLSKETRRSWRRLCFNFWVKNKREQLVDREKIPYIFRK